MHALIISAWNHYWVDQTLTHKNNLVPLDFQPLTHIKHLVLVDFEPLTHKNNLVPVDFDRGGIKNEGTPPHFRGVVSPDRTRRAALRAMLGRPRSSLRLVRLRAPQAV